MGYSMWYTLPEAQGLGIDSKELEYGPTSRTIYAGCPSSPGFGVRGQSSSDFLASTVRVLNQVALMRKPHSSPEVHFRVIYFEFRQYR